MNITEENWKEESKELAKTISKVLVDDECQWTRYQRIMWLEEKLQETFQFLITSIHEKHEKEMEAVRKEERVLMEKFLIKSRNIDPDYLGDCIEEYRNYIQSLTQEDVTNLK